MVPGSSVPTFSGKLKILAGVEVTPAITFSSGMPRCRNSVIGTRTLAGDPSGARLMSVEIASGNQPSLTAFSEISHE